VGGWGVSVAVRTDMIVHSTGVRVSGVAGIAGVGMQAVSTTRLSKTRTKAKRGLKVGFITCLDGS